MNNIAALMLAYMRSTLGQMESPANSNIHPTVTWYNKTIEYLARSWNYCAAGVTKAFWHTPAKPLIKPRAYVPWMMQDFLNGYAGGKLIWIDSSTAPIRPGDVVFFDWSKPTDGRKSVWTGNHVGVVESVKDSNTVVTLEHNTGVPGTGNEGVARKLRDTKYIVAVGRPNYPGVATPTIPGTNLPLLEIDGDLGPKTIFALSTIMRARGYTKVVPGKTVTTELVKAIQTELVSQNKRDYEGKQLVVDGKGFGSNSASRYPKTGRTRTISALQIGHGVSRAKADGYFSKGESSEVKRIQRDINLGGTKDSPLYTG